MAKHRNLVGKRFGMLLVIEQAPSKRFGNGSLRRCWLIVGKTLNGLL